MKRKQPKKRLTLLDYDTSWQLLGSQYHEPQRTPFIHAASIVSGVPCALTVNFTASGPERFWPRLKLAFRYWWLIASGKLEYAVLAKVRD